MSIVGKFTMESYGTSKTFGAHGPLALPPRLKYALEFN